MKNIFMPERRRPTSDLFIRFFALSGRVLNLDVGASAMEIWLRGKAKSRGLP
jgi:hypothetical protein